METKADLIRYDIRRDRLGWTVYDLRTGRVALVDGVPQVGLGMDEADAIADRLSVERPRGDGRTAGFTATRGGVPASRGTGRVVGGLSGQMAGHAVEARFVGARLSVAPFSDSQVLAPWPARLRRS